MKKGEGGREIWEAVSVVVAAAAGSNNNIRVRTLKLLRTNTVDECPDTQPSTECVHNM